MGAPMPDMEPVENTSAEALLSSLKTIDPGERRKHASVFNYWLSIRANRQFPPIRDLDPLEISDAGPWSVLLEMIGGGEDAEIRHLGQAINLGDAIERIGQAPNPSLLSCIAGKLPIVAACREAFAFEDQFATENGPMRCWVTLLPFSANGTWIDYVYGFVSLDPGPDGVEQAPETAEESPEPEAEEVEPQPAEEMVVPFENAPDPVEDMVVPFENAPVEEEPAFEEMPEPVQETSEPEPTEFEQPPEPVAEDEPAVDSVLAETESGPEPGFAGKSGFSAKLIQGLTSVGFYGKLVEVEPDLSSLPFQEAPGDLSEPEPDLPSVPFAQEVAEVAQPTMEGTLQSKLAEVRAKADEARMAKLHANIALYQGLSAAYDFALDAEEQPDDYLKLVEAQGLKIQLRSPMTPVVKLAFDGLCDDSVISQLEAVLAWALKHDLPRGSLAERIEAEGGIAPILNGKAAA